LGNVDQSSKFDPQYLLPQGVFLEEYKGDEQEDDKDRSIRTVYVHVWRIT